MRIVDYKFIKLRQKRRAAKKKMVRRGFVLLVALVFATTCCYVALQLPLPEAQARARELSQSTAAQTDIAWPGYGQSALGNPEYGILETNGQQQPAPTASVAKVMTALAVLRKKPIINGQIIPRLVIDETDVASYNYYLSHDGSNVKVELGEEITEYQALQALLLPSANNMAETLARWAFGSLDSYSDYANELARSLGMKQSYFADASGFSPRTVSTASDLTLLAIAALADPTIAEIIGQSAAVVPVAGEVRNTNRVLGQEGIVGMKTGNTNEAGGCFMVAGKKDINGQSVTTVGVIMGAPTVGQAMTDAVRLMQTAYTNYQLSSAITANQVVADYEFAWGANSVAYLQNDETILSWRGADIAIGVALEPIEAGVNAGNNVGAVTITSPLQKKTVPIILRDEPTLPSLGWRLKRLLGL